MPSIEAVEQFKAIIQNLASEPEIRAQMGLPPDEIRPPESQLDDLADLLGGMPTSQEDGVPQDADDSVEAVSESDLDDLFAVPVPAPEEAPPGPNLDDLFSDLAPPAVESPESQGPDGGEVAFEPAAEFNLDEFLSPTESGETVEEPSLEGSAADFDEAIADVESVESVEEFGDLSDFDVLAGLEPSTEGGESLARSSQGVSPEELDDAFFETPGEDLFPESTAGADAAEEDFQFGDVGVDTDFPELAGFADTKAEDVEAFDAMGEADEFQLGDFESQFGITADDHTDAELLNPAQSVDLESLSAQRELSYTDEEFEAIQRALLPLPLNLRLAVEELIGEKEVVLDDLERVVRLLLGRAQLRTLANAVGRILGRKIIIPAGFEKGSGYDLEARRGSLWYNLQTVMWPTIRVALLASAAAALLVVLGWTFLYRPLKANALYEQGLVALRANQGAQADQLFAEAHYEWASDDRFFQYAEAYLDTGDYDRARRKYLELLQPSVKPYREDDKATLEKRFGAPLDPLPQGLTGAALINELTSRKATVDAYYDYVVRLLSSSQGGAGIEGDIPALVIFRHPVEKGILDYSRFETEYGFEGQDPEGPYRRADAVLSPLLDQNPGNGRALLRKTDNFLAWGEKMSRHDVLDQANTALSDYLRRYGFDAQATWRFVRLFMLTDQESELLRLRDQIARDPKMPVDGEVMAQFAGWLIDHEEQRRLSDQERPVRQKTLEEEYGMLPAKTAELPSTEAPRPVNLTRSEGDSKKLPDLTPPYKYPYSSEPYRPDYLASVDTLLLRAMDTQKTLPELHYQLSRYYRLNDDSVDEKKALAAADVYFQRMPPRLLHQQRRPELRVATSLRIGEIFDAEDQPLQAEKYYLDAQRHLVSYRDLGLIPHDQRMADVFRSLGNLLYHQAPGLSTPGLGQVPGAWDQASRLFTIFESDHGDDPEVTYRQGVISYERQNFSESVKRFFALDRAGARGEPSGRDNPNLLYAMGNALFRSGNFASAEGYYRELLDLLRAQRQRITEWDPTVRASHKALAQRLYETWNNLAAAEYRANTTFQAGTPEFRQALQALTTARAQAQILGTELYEDHSELDVTTVDQSKLDEIRKNEESVVARTRKEKGLIEANLQVLSLLETSSPNRRAALADQLEIFARIPLELNQPEAP